MAISAGAGLTANIVGGVGQSKALGYAAAQAERNAGLYDRAAGDALSRGAADAQRPLLQAGQVRGAQVAGAGASGVAVGSSQVAGITAATEAYGRQDSDTVLNNAFREAWGLRAKGDEEREQAHQLMEQRKQVPLQTFLGSLGPFAQLAGAAYGGASDMPKRKSAIGQTATTNPVAWRKAGGR